MLNKLELRGNRISERGAMLVLELLRGQRHAATSVPVLSRLDEEFLGYVDLGGSLPRELRWEVAELTAFLAACNIVAAVHRGHRQRNSPAPVPLPDCRAIYESVVGKPLKPSRLPPETPSLSLPELVDLVLDKLARDRTLPALTPDLRKLAVSQPPTTPSPASGGQGTALSPASGGQDTSLSPASGGQDTSPSPASGGQDTSLSPASGGQDTALSPAPGGQDTSLSPASGGQDTSVSPASGGQETALSPASGGQDTSLSPASGGHGTSLSPASGGQGTLQFPASGWQGTTPLASSSDSAEGSEDLGAGSGTNSADAAFSSAVERCELSGVELRLPSLSLFDVPRRPGRLRAIESLCLSSGDISVLDCASLNALPGLTRLDVSHNRIRRIEGCLELRRLAWVDLSDNDLADVSALVLWSCVRHLDLSRNRISDPSGLPASLESLTIRDNRLRSALSLRVLCMSAELRSLDVSGNPVMQRVPNWRVRLVSLLPRLAGA